MDNNFKEMFGEGMILWMVRIVNANFDIILKILRDGNILKFEQYFANGMNPTMSVTLLNGEKGEDGEWLYKYKDGTYHVMTDRTHSFFVEGGIITDGNFGF